MAGASPHKLRRQNYPLSSNNAETGEYSTATAPHLDESKPFEFRKNLANGCAVDSELFGEKAFRQMIADLKLASKNRLQQH